jgi:hypothetical protein
MVGIQRRRSNKRLLRLTLLFLTLDGSRENKKVPSPFQFWVFKLARRRHRRARRRLNIQRSLSLE